MSGTSSSRVGEIAATRSRGAPVEASQVLALIEGYAGPAHGRWIGERTAVAVSGSAEIAVSDDIVVAVDGRIDNHGDLADVVGFARDASSGELIAESYRRHGLGAVDRILGDVAAIIVLRDSEAMIVFRDLCGGRPLHVASDQAGWAVASEWQPLARRSGARRMPNRDWFASAFIGHSIAPTATPYEGVEIVLPGHAGKHDTGGWTQTRVADWVVPHLRDTREGVYADEFRALFDEAVRCRLAPAGRVVGVTLSGGLDSTSVLSTARDISPATKRTALCLPLTDPTGDERSVQAFMADAAEAELRWVDMGGLGPFGPGGPEALFERWQAPPQVINWFYGDALAAEAERARVSTVMDGEDGDGSVGGSDTYLADLLVRGRWVAWLSEVNAMRRLGAVSGREMLELSVRLSLPPRMRRVLLSAGGNSPVPETIAPPLSRQLGLEDRLSREHLNRAWTPGNVFAFAQREVGNIDHVAPKYTTISEPWRRRGVELTHPWGDRRLMSFCMGLPYVHVRMKAFPKIILRQAMKDRLPAWLLEHNGKADMSEIVTRAMQGPDRHIVESGLALAETQSEWFARDGVQALRLRLESGKPGAAAGATRVAMFARWLRWCDAA